MRVGIVGSRNCKDFTVKKMAEFVPAGCTRIVSGGARGVDTLAKEYARQRGIPLIELLPDYKAHGRQAPLLRNLKIAENCELLLAFWDMDSRGTANTISACIRRNIPVRIIPL